MGFETCESSYSFAIPKAAREKPTFKITAINSESFDEEASLDYTSLWDVLLDPKFLEHTETSAILKQIRNRHETRNVHLTGGKILFNDTECQILTIRDVSAR